MTLINNFLIKLKENIDFKLANALFLIAYNYEKISDFKNAITSYE